MPPGPHPEALGSIPDVEQPGNHLHMKEGFDAVKTDSGSTGISTRARRSSFCDSGYVSQHPSFAEDSDETCFSSRRSSNRSGSISRQNDGEPAAETRENSCPLRNLDTGTQNDVDRGVPKSIPDAYEDRD